MSCRSRIALSVLLLVLTSCPSWAQRGRPVRVSGPAYRAGEVLVGYDQRDMVKALGGAQTQYGATVVKSLPKVNVSLLRSGQASRDIYGFCRALAKLPGVRFAEPNYRRQVMLEEPNDPAYVNVDSLYAPFDPDMDPSDYVWYQWGLHQIEALAAWTIYPNTYYTSTTRPSLVPKIAVVDTGLDVGGTDGIAHPDFINVGGTSCDTALGGQVDLANSRNVISGATPTDFADDFGHGTAVAGAIGAATNNGGSGDGNGIAGLAYNCQLMSIKTFDNTGNGTAADTATAIVWAVDHGALVVNISAGDVFYSQAEQDAVDYAWEHGTLVVAAAGNEGDGANRTFYPAACNGALGVGATEINDLPASYSNFGEYVGVAAPGGDISYFPLAAWLIWTTMPTEDVPLKPLSFPDTGMYSYQTGTSMACPFVAGLAGLYASRWGITQSTEGGVLRMYQALQRGSENSAETVGWNPNYGWGRINAEQTLLDNNYRGASVGCITGQLIYIDTVAPNKEVQAKLAGTSTVVASATTRPDGMFRIANLAPGNYDLTATYFGEPGLVSNIPVVASADTPHVELLISGDVNEPPTAPTTVAITPTWPTGDQNLTASALGSTDPDGTTPSYVFEWSKLEAGSSTWTLWGNAGETLDNSLTTSGDRWKIRAQATDGSLSSDWVESASVTVDNTRPTTPTGVTIAPTNPGPERLTATATGSTDVNDNPFVYKYQWSKRNAEGTWTPWGYTAQSLPGSNLRIWETWRVRAKAYDGNLSSFWKIGPSVKILPMGIYTPRPGTRNVPRNTAVYIDFRWAPVQSSAVSHVRLKQGTTVVPVTMSWETEKKLKLTPQAILKPGAWYRVWISPGIECLDGRMLYWTESHAYFVTEPLVAPATLSVAAAPTAVGAQVTVNLSAAATVRTVICNIAGRVVAELPERDLPAGISSLVWNGRGNSGTKVPSGTYLVRVEATGEEGTQASAVGALQMR